LKTFKAQKKICGCGRLFGFKDLGAKELYTQREQ